MDGIRLHTGERLTFRQRDQIDKAKGKQGCDQETQKRLPKMFEMQCLDQECADSE